MNLSPFEFEQKELRTLVIDGEPWFVGKDVATILGYKNPTEAIRTNVEEEDKLREILTDSGQAREMVIINESGLYSLILSSKLEAAKKFKRWVTSEVLPKIRKEKTEDIIKVSDVAAMLVSLNTKIEELQKQTEIVPKLFNAGKSHEGAMKVIEKELNGVFDNEEYLTVRQYLNAKKIIVDNTQYKQIALMASQFYQSSKKKEPRKVKNSTTMVYAYSNADLEYVNQAIRSVLGI